MQGESPAVLEAAERRRHGRYLLSFVVKLASIVLVLVLVFTFVFGIAVMHGEDMYPRIRDGDTYFYYRLARDYRIGDVVTFEQDGTRYVARIVAVGGDMVDVSAAGDLLVNGHVQDEEVFYRMNRTEAAIALPCQIGEGSYFLLSDFRTAGMDSRSFGAVAEEDLDGKVISLLRRRGI